MRIALALAVGMAWGAPAGAAGSLESLRAAVAAEPDRPGLRIALAHRLLDAGDAEGAEAEAERVLAAWPGSTRARIVLARVARARGDEARARALLDAVIAEAPAPIAAEARRVRAGRAPAAGRWSVWGTVGAHRDSAPRTSAFTDDPAVADPGAPAPAWRLLVGAEASYRDGPWTARLGADRTVHVGGTPAADADLTAARLDGAREWGTGPVSFGLRGDGAAALAGRDARFHHAAGGLTGWVRGAGAVFAPWLSLRGRYVGYGDAAGRPPLEGDEFHGELVAGLGAAGETLRGGARLGALWVGPGDRTGFLELGGDLDLGLRLAPLSLTARAGLGWRRPGERGDEARPRAGAEVRVALGGGVSLAAEALWFAAVPLTGEADVRDRWLAGSRLEVRR